jgi:hypothetical protein
MSKSFVLSNSTPVPVFALMCNGLSSEKTLDSNALSAKSILFNTTSVSFSGYCALVSTSEAKISAVLAFEIREASN